MNLDKLHDWLGGSRDQGTSDDYKETGEGMKAFVTGNYAYGTPTDKSDVDLVVFISEQKISGSAGRIGTVWMG